MPGSELTYPKFDGQVNASLWTCHACGGGGLIDVATRLCVECWRVVVLGPWARRSPGTSAGEVTYDDLIAALRGPEGEVIAREVFAGGCKKCWSAEHPYWHPAGQPCPDSATRGPTPEGR